MLMTLGSTVCKFIAADRAVPVTSRCTRTRPSQHARRAWEEWAGVPRFGPQQALPPKSQYTDTIAPSCARALLILHRGPAPLPAPLALAAAKGRLQYTTLLQPTNRCIARAAPVEVAIAACPGAKLAQQWLQVQGRVLLGARHKACQLPRSLVVAMASKASAKRKGSDEVPDAPAAKKAAAGALVNPKRVRVLKEGDIGKGPVVYWCAAAPRGAPLPWAL